MITRCLTVLLIGSAMTALAEEGAKVDPEAIKKLRELEKQLLEKEEKAKKSGPPTATLSIEQGGTMLGDIVIELNAEKAPVSTLNFADYAKAGYYNGTIFHRVIPTFMIQGGGFTADVDKKAEGLRPPIENEWTNGLKNKKGTIAMARLPNNADSATSQFFINVADNNALDVPRDGAGYAVFGKVTKGMDVVEKIRDTKTVVNPKYPSPSPVVPETPVIIKSVKIENLDREAIKQVLAKRGEALRTYAQKVADDLGKPLNETDSGLFYIVLKEGDGAKPTLSDRLMVHYTGTFLDGTKFDSSHDRGQPQPITLRGVIPGWTEGVGMMKVGGKRKLIIPWKLGYGSRGKPPVMPPKADLVFEVELVEVVGK